MITNEVPTEELLHEQIDLCVNLLHKYNGIEPGNEERESSLTSMFLKALLKLYLTIQQNPALQKASMYQDFLQSSVPLVARMQDDIVRFQMRIEYQFHIDPYNDPWEAVCWMRSAFQAFLEMYQFTLGTDLQEKYIDLSFEDFDPEDIDDVIEAYILNVTPVPEDEIPVGMPHSHWWWWGEKAEMVGV